MTIAAILALAVVALAGGGYAYLVYSPKPQMPSLSSEVQHRERSYPAHCIFPSSPRSDREWRRQYASNWRRSGAMTAMRLAEAYGSVPSFVLIAEMCFSIGGLNWRRLA
jgi:hypothetical protein